MPFRRGIYVTQDSLDNWENAKCHTKPNKNRWKHRPNYGGFEIVKPEEVVKKLDELGLKASLRSVQDYAKKGLIDKPQKRALGQGMGSASEYPNNAHYQYFVSWKYIHELKIKAKETAEIRELASMVDGFIEEYANSTNEPDNQDAIDYMRNKLLKHSSDEEKAKLAELWWVAIRKNAHDLRGLMKLTE